MRFIVVQFSAYLTEFRKYLLTTRYGVSLRNLLYIKSDKKLYFLDNVQSEFCLSHPAWGNVTGKPTTFTPVDHTHDKADVTDLGDSTLTVPRIHLTDGAEVSLTSTVNPLQIGTGTSSNVVMDCAGMIQARNNGTAQTLDLNLLGGTVRANGTAVSLAGHTHADTLASDSKRQGFLNQTETSISFDGTNTFTLTDAGAGWSYYRAGIKYTISGNKTVTLVAPASAPAPAGDYHVYIDATNGTLTCDTVGWNLNDTKVPVASVIWDNALTPKYHLADERHTALIDSRMQYYLHFADGAQLAEVPTLSGQTVNTDTNAAKTCGISACTLLDQDMIHTIAALSDPDGTTDSYSLWYRTAASTWAWKASKMPFAYNTGASNAIQFDSAGTLTDCTSFGPGALTRWVNSYLLITNKAGVARHIIVPGRAEFTTLAAAQAEDVAGFSWAGFEVDEAVIAYRLTWTTYTATSLGKCMLAATPQLVNMTTSVGVSTSVDHNSLTGLQGGATEDYYHLTSAQHTDLTDGGTTTLHTHPRIVGEMTLWPTDTAPSGWLLCYGQAVSRTTYAALYALMGVTYGTGNGSTTFNLPDLRGRMPLGQDDMGGSSANRVTAAAADSLGGSAGAETHTLTTAELAAHNHTLDGGLNGALGSTTRGMIAVNLGSNNTVSRDAGGGSPHNNMPPYLTLNFIIFAGV